LWVLTKARTAALTCSGSFGHRSTISTKSGFFGGKNAKQNAKSPSLFFVSA
jgi:hypothetical protein